MKTARIVFAGLCLSALLSGGCATIVDGYTQEVSFQSSPEGATVAVDGRVMGKTPLTVRLDRRAYQSVLVQKAGYAPQSQRLTVDINRWFWGNLPPFHLVDWASGAVNELIPSQYAFVLGQEEGLGQALLLEQQKARAKALLAHSYKDVFAELSERQGGPHVTAFMDLMGIPRVNQLDAIDRMKTLAYLYKDVPTYADRVVEDLMDHGYTKH